MTKIALFPLVLFGCLAGTAHAAPTGSTHVLGAKKQTLSSATDTVSAGYYAATMLHAVDTDLAPANIKSGVTIFGETGTFTYDAATWPPYPTAGGEWVLVPGSASLGTNDFYVMKYEAKNVGGVATSQAALTPWASIPQTTLLVSPFTTGAIQRCAALGPGYHLLNLAEVQTINLNIAAQTANWSDGVIGSAVGTGGLKRGNVSLSDSASYSLTTPGPDFVGTLSAGSDRTATSKAKLVLSNGKTTPDNEIWDWSGNVWEWVYGAGTDGTLGAPGGVAFYGNAGWLEWTNGSLSAHERAVLGPSNGAWTSAYGVGKYLIGASSNAVYRGGSWNDVAVAGVFSFDAYSAPSEVGATLGFRCAR